MRYFTNLVLGTCVFAAGCAGEAARSPTSPTMGALAQTQAQVTPGEPQSAALTPQAQSGAQLAFRGSLQQTETGELQSPTLLVITGSAEGTATHLGRYTMTFRAAIGLTTRLGVGTRHG